MALRLAIIASATLVGSVFYSLHLNPEIRFYKEVSQIQTSWSKRMDREPHPKTVVFGGSSCMFSIVGEQMLSEFRIPTVNRGMMAGISAKVLALHALEDMRKGDTLIAAIEPGQLTQSLTPPSVAIQFSYGVGRPNWVTQEALGIGAIRSSSAILALRPGSYHTVTLLGKIAQGRNLYRYSSLDATESGWMRTSVRIPLAGPPGNGDHLSEDGIRFIQKLKERCDLTGIRVAYSLPWAYCPPEHLASFQKQNVKFLRMIQPYLPILKDEKLGGESNQDLFADTGWHLNELGSEQRTRSFGRSIRDWEVWTDAELRALEAQP